MIQVQDLRFSYGGRPVLRGVSFTLEQGQALAVLGNNGAGKSTLVQCVNRILRPEAGAVLVDGTGLGTLSRKRLAQTVSYVPQKCELSHITVYDTVLLGRKPYFRFGAEADDHDVVEHALESVGLQDFRLRYLNELSGGEVQKVMLARAIAQEPRLMLLDEPTSNLDPRNQYEAMELVRHCAHSHGIAVLAVLHDLNLALRYCDRFLFLHEGAVHSCGGPEIVTEARLAAVYGMPMACRTVDGVPVVIPGLGG